MKYIFILLSLLFVLFSFTPTLVEINSRNLLPKERYFTLEHNYLFDYNFYLSRIREGQEGNWLVSEKYYNKVHPASLFQIIYLYLGKIGLLFNADPPVVYHASRIILGFILLLISGFYIHKHFRNNWAIPAFLLAVTMGSWPIPVKVGESWRFATHMGWWSVMDSLQRITTIPHVLFGQIMLVVFVWVFSSKSPKSLKLPKLLMWGFVGLITGIIFPPTLIIVYTVMGILSILEIIADKSLRSLSVLKWREWIWNSIVPRVIFIILSFPSFIYLQMMFKVQPWKALALFDIQHRIPLPFKEYLLALGSVFILGLFGLIWAIFRLEKKLLGVVSWFIGIFVLIAVFEKVPQQSPLRFTEGLLNVPAGILAMYFLYNIWQIGEKYRRRGIIVITVITIITVILLGLAVMWSMVGWLTDQVRWRREGTWKVAIGAQIIYPLKDFMEGIFYLRDYTNKGKIVLGYITASNYIPAYAGNYTYIGHANTPDEDLKEPVVASFFKGKTTIDEAKNFLQRENISYIYFGPQERELGNISDLHTVYPFLKEIYKNEQVLLYEIN